MVNMAEAPNGAVEQPMKEVAVKEKKPRASKEKKPKSVKAAPHPPYFEMIKEALLALKEKGGSSPHAVAKHMEERHKAVLPANFRKILALQLKNSASKGKLIKVKASYKLSESGKKDKATIKAPKAAAAAKKKKPEPKGKAVAPKGAKLTKKSEAVKKTEVVKKTKAKAAKPKSKAVQKTKKRAAPVKAKAKQPKSIKSPAAKKARKAGA